ncbi:MAG: S-adenosylmethionine decarboxylase [Chloroflexi bacterium]|nr:S-adenosylmethionine decarboxylase [Chloroflexota bacterium]
MHLALDAYSRDRDRLADLNLIYEVLDQCPTQIGMTKIAPPYVFHYVGANAEDWGITGLVLIAESHIAIHTFPAYAHVNIDVFSCKPFDSEAVVEYMKNKLALVRIKRRLLQRGLEYLPERPIAPAVGASHG